MEQVQEIKDRYGNRIVIREWKITIYLKERGEKRYIWNIKDWRLIIRRDFEKHYYSKIGWYWYNSDLLHYLQQNWHGDMQIITRQKRSRVWYITTIKDVLEKWIYQNRVSNWYEVQIIMKLSNMIINVFKT